MSVRSQMSAFDDLRELPLRQIWDGIHARVIIGERLSLGVVELDPGAVAGSTATSTNSSGSCSAGRSRSGSATRRESSAPETRGRSRRTSCTRRRPGWRGRCARRVRAGAPGLGRSRAGRAARAALAVDLRTYVRMEATILHADLDSFYASVEQRDDPSLRGLPVIVGAGVVLAASYEAKAFGVQTPMPLGRARRLCPEAIVVPPRMDAYSAASKAAYRVFDDSRRSSRGCRSTRRSSTCAACVGRRGAGRDRRAATTRSRERVGLPITVGVARTKFLAKVASAVAKPDGLLLVAPDRELDFLHALPVERLWGVGAVTAEKLRSRGIRRSASSPASPRRPRGDARPRAGPPPARARPQPRPAPGSRDGVGARSARSVHSAVRRGHRPRSMPSRSASSSASPDG